VIATAIEACELTAALRDHRSVTMSAKKDRTLAAGEFKATCLAVLDEVAASGRGVLITKRGEPVERGERVAKFGARHLPMRRNSQRTLASCLTH
jgi:hypothetical protein